jgi:hypothetical protein
MGQNDMSKLLMKAPPHTSGASIEGHAYKVPKDGVIEVVSDHHVETLKRHGFTPCDDVEDIHAKIEELGKDDKAELVTIIEEHGGEADVEMSLKKLRSLAHDQVGGQDEEA